MHMAFPELVHGVSAFGKFPWEKTLCSLVIPGAVDAQPIKCKPQMSHFPKTEHSKTGTKHEFAKYKIDF